MGNRGSIFYDYVKEQQDAAKQDHHNAETLKVSKRQMYVATFALILSIGSIVLLILDYADKNKSKDQLTRQIEQLKREQESMKHDLRKLSKQLDR